MTKECKLIYAKSKVYVHTGKDTIAGYLALVDNTGDQKYTEKENLLLSWLPQSIIQEMNEEDKFVMVESTNKPTTLVNPPPSDSDSYAFSLPVKEIYSMLVYPPSITHWYGTITINLLGGLTLPALHFHDDENSTALTSPRPSLSDSLYPPSRHISSTWGGQEFLLCLKLYVTLLRSQLENSLFLVEPTEMDAQIHLQPFLDESVLETSTPSSSTPPRHGQRTSILHYALNAHNNHLSRNAIRFNNHQHSRSADNMRQLFPDNVLDATPSVDNLTSVYRNTIRSFANITISAKQTAHSMLRHPLAKPIIPHLPTPVQSLAVASGNTSMSGNTAGEYDSARIYLAKWARRVAEEGDKNRLKENDILQSTDLGVSTELGKFELLDKSQEKTTRDPSNPITLEEWQTWFDGDGKPSITESEMLLSVFRRSIESSAKIHIWPFILGVIEWNTNEKERIAAWNRLDTQYAQLKDTWKNKSVFHDKKVAEERHRIRVDCLRTDRNLPLFAKSDTELDEMELGVGTLDSSSGSESELSDDNEGTSQAVSNAHVRRLQGILLTYNFYEEGLGYVQGMSDLCAPLYVISEASESWTFWCFVSVMNRTKENFLADQSGMSRKLITLQELIKVMDPELYIHFAKSDNLNMFFCFRWILVNFKREFNFNDILTLWEALFTRPHSQHFELFIVLAVLESHRDIILKYLMEFDEMLKYCNDLSGTIDVQQTLNAAEVLYDNFVKLYERLKGKKLSENLSKLI